MIAKNAIGPHSDLQEIIQGLSHENRRLETEVQRLEAYKQQLEAQVEWFKEQVGLANRRQFAPSAEPTPAGQEAMLFDEAEALASAELPDPQSETITYTRRKAAGWRELQLANLPTEEIVYEIPEAERICPACQGPLHEMGHDVRREVQFVPAVFKIVLHCCTKYACRDCDHNGDGSPVLTAPMPRPAFPGSLASPSAVAHIMDQKFVEGSPLYRQEQSIKRQGLDLSRQTMANWMLAGADWLTWVYERMRQLLLDRDILHADETTVQVLKEPGRAPQAQSYMWLYHSGRDGPPIALFDYQPGRCAEHPIAFLSGYCGYLHVDGYSAYERLPDVTLVGCWAHARRKFIEAAQLVPAYARKQGASAEATGLAFCNRLFAIERDLHDANPTERHAKRLERSQPLLVDFRKWLDKTAPTVTPKMALRAAVTYCINQWSKLTAFLADGRLELDNNRSERAIKPFVIGRKNWLFANTPRGAHSSAVIYSIVETAKENGLDPFRYLIYLFEQLPNIDCKDQLAVDRLLPWADPVQANCRIPSKPTR
jgi:transposase